MKTFKTALIGCGRIGFSLGFDKKREQPASHTAALFKNKKINLVAAADTNEKSLIKWKKFAKKNKSPAFTFSKSDELYEKIKNIEIIVIAVNEQSHLEECLKAIHYKPRLVILEKPVALNSSEGKIIEEEAEKSGVFVMVNHERRFDKNYEKAKSLLSKIGTIQNVKGELDSGLRVYHKDFEKDGTYSLLHDGTHLVDIINFLFEVELKNPLVANIFYDEKKVVRNFTALYSTQKIPEIQIKMSGRSRFFEFRIEILGTEGKIVIGNGIFEFYLRKESSLYTGFYSLKKQKIKLPKRSEYFSGMVQNAVDFLEEKSELKSPLNDALNDLKILEEIKANFE